jgi:hypothetical protein
MNAQHEMDHEKGPTRGVHLFLDASNVWLGAVSLGRRRGEGRVALHARHLRDFMAQGRAIGSAHCILNASGGPGLHQQFSRFWVVDSVEPGRFSGREQFADQALQQRIFEVARLHPRTTLVVGTGDGAGHEIGRGFLPLFDVLTRAGTRIEIVSWAATLNATLSNWAHAHGAVRQLDAHYEEVTFVRDARWALAPKPDHKTNWRPAA